MSIGLMKEAISLTQSTSIFRDNLGKTSFELDIEKKEGGKSLGI